MRTRPSWTSSSRAPWSCSQSRTRLVRISLLAQCLDANLATGEGEGLEANDSTYPLTLTAWVVHFLQAADDPIVTEGVVKSCLMTPSPG